MPNSKIGGIAYVKVDGAQLPLRGNFTVSPSPTERTGVAGQDGVHGFTEMPRVPYIQGDISLPDSVSIEDLAAMENVTVQADLANNKSYVLREAWCKSALEINTSAGQCTVRFEGVSCDEI